VGLLARMLPTTGHRGQRRLSENAAAFPFVLAVITISALVMWFLAR
jgi:hypothetical protein